MSFIRKKREVCSECGTLRESAKEWRNPAFGKIYAALALADRQEPGDEFPNWLNANGFANLTCCPACHVDDFIHVEDCPIGNKLDEAVTELEAYFTAHPEAPTPTTQDQPTKRKK